LLRCGGYPYEYLFKSGKYRGVDVEDSGRPINMKKPDYFYNSANFSFRDEEFDRVRCTQVLEHVPDPLSLILLYTLEKYEAFDAKR